MRQKKKKRKKLYVMPNFDNYMLVRSDFFYVVVIHEKMSFPATVVLLIIPKSLTELEG